MTPDQAYVYIMASSFKHLYIGVTARLQYRIQDHKNAVDPKCFTARYKINQLVYYECFESISQAIAREKTDQGLVAYQENSIDRCSEPNLEGS